MSFSEERIHNFRHDARIMVRELGLLKEAYFEIGVTLAMRHLLIELKKTPQPTINDMAERLLLDKSSASRLIKKAAQRGYVTYQVDEKDRRRRFLQLTETGERTLNAFELLAQQQVRDAFATLTPDEIETVHRGMALFAKGLQTARQNRSQKS